MREACERLRIEAESIRNYFDEFAKAIEAEKRAIVIIEAKHGKKRT